jgi:DNA polymerase III subunit epsilon
VHPDEFAIQLKHLQPAVKRRAAAVSRPRTSNLPPVTSALTSRLAGDAGTLPAAHVIASPVAMRAWARANGYEVGERGRLPAEVADAYRRAHEGAGRS